MATTADPMKFSFSSCLCIAFALAMSAEAQVQIQLGDVKDSRTTGQFFAGLEVEIKLLGDSLTDAQSMRVLVKTAVDDTGRDLVDHEKQEKDFENLNTSGGQGTKVTLKLKNPARKAGAIKELSGEVELFVPKNDPDSVMKVVGFQKLGGKPIASPAFITAGIEIAAYTKEQSDAIKAKKAEDAKKDSKANLGEAISAAFGEMFGMGGGPNDITVQIKDPNQKLVGMEFQDANGKKIKNNGSSSWGNKDKQMKTYHFDTKLPEATRLVIYLSTPKSVVKVPYSLTNVFLP